MAAMTADNNQINILLFGHSVHFLSGMTENNMLIICAYIQLLSQAGYPFGRLLL